MLIIGDKIFLANYGAGVVKQNGIISEISTVKEYIKIHLIFDEMNIFLPKENIFDCKYREVMKKEEMEKYISIIYDEPEVIEKSWSARYRKNREKLQGLNMKAICLALRDLYHLKKNLMLPQGEEKILERAEGLVASEVSMIFKFSFKESVNKLRDMSILEEMNKL